MRLMPLFFIFLTACSMQANKKPIAEQHLLFIIHAQKASFVYEPETTISGELTLQDAAKSVVFFSERPNRRAGNLSVESFLENWNQGEDNLNLEPPNAGLVYYSPSESPRASTAKYSEINLVLRNPHYDSRRDTLTFDVTLLSPSSHLPEGLMLEPTLFIDTAAR